MVMRTCHHPILLLAFLAAFMSSACTVIAQDRQEHPRIESHAYAQDTSTPLGAALSNDVKRHENMSGFRLLDNARESLAIRLAMVEAAEKSIDLQYYIIHDDVASNLMLEALLRAAERGVRVRFLIDGITFSEVDGNLAVLDNQPNIQIRVFNPVFKPGIPLMAKLRVGFLDLEGFTRRMHNKSLIVDNQLSVTGGRNLGDEYFDENPDTNFKDLDTLAAGPITARISNSFDKYWNDGNAWLIADLHPVTGDPQKMKDLRARMKKEWADKMDATGGTIRMERLADRLKDGRVPLTWARAELSADEPDKIDQAPGQAASKPLSRLQRLVAQGSTEFLAITPYFVPGDDGVAWFKSLEARNMQVKVLTNSLAATDVVAVHTGYAKYREALVRDGIDLFEFKPIAGQRPKQRLAGSSAPPTASLHSKAYVIDRKDAIVGSYNIDPRSEELNTELIIIIHSPEIAAQLVKLFEHSTAPAQSYHVLYEDGDLVWKTEEKGRVKTYETDPNAGLWRRVQAGFMSLLPIEDQL